MGKKRADRQGTIRKVKSGRHQVRVLDPVTNKRVSLGTYPTVADASAALTNAISDQQKHAWVNPAGGKITVEVAVERWLQSKAHLRPSTRALYKWLADTHILPTLGSIEVARVDATTVEAWWAHMLASGVSRSTAPKAYRALKGVFKTAVKARAIAVSPVDIPGAASEPRISIRVPEPADVWRIAAAIDVRFRALVILGALSGLRWGELAGLRRRHVDLLRGTVVVEKQTTEVRGLLSEDEEPKTDSSKRTVALPELARQALAEHLGLTDASADAYVFTMPKGGPLRRSTFGSRFWRPTLAKLGLQGMRFHSLRHIAGTMATVGGATTAEVMAVLGHSTQDAALRYQGVMSGRDRVVAEGIDAIMRAAIQVPVAEVVSIEKGTGRARRFATRRKSSL